MKIRKCNFPKKETKEFNLKLNAFTKKMLIYVTIFISIITGMFIVERIDTRENYGRGGRDEVDVVLKTLIEHEENKGK